MERGRRHVSDGGLLSCPSWGRTRTLLIQSQACCQLHQGAICLVRALQKDRRTRTRILPATTPVEQPFKLFDSANTCRSRALRTNRHRLDSSTPAQSFDPLSSRVGCAARRDIDVPQPTNRHPAAGNTPSCRLWSGTRRVFFAALRGESLRHSANRHPRAGVGGASKDNQGTLRGDQHFWRQVRASQSEDR